MEHRPAAPDTRRPLSAHLPKVAAAGLLATAVVAIGIVIPRDLQTSVAGPGARETVRITSIPGLPGDRSLDAASYTTDFDGGVWPADDWQHLGASCSRADARGITADGECVVYRAVPGIVKTVSAVVQVGGGSAAGLILLKEDTDAEISAADAVRFILEDGSAGPEAIIEERSAGRAAWARAKRMTLDPEGLYRLTLRATIGGYDLYVENLRTDESFQVNDPGAPVTIADDDARLIGLYLRDGGYAKRFDIAR